MIVTVQSKVSPEVSITGTYLGAEFEVNVHDPTNGSLVIDDPHLHVVYEVSRAHWEIVETRET